MENKQGKEHGRKLQREKIQAIGDVMRMPRGKLAFVCMDWQLMDCFVKLVKCLTKCQDLRSGATSLAASQHQPSCEVGIMMLWGAPIDLTLRSPQHPFACWQLVLVGYLTSASFYLSHHLSFAFSKGTNMSTMAVLWGVAIMNGKDLQPSL